MKMRVHKIIHMPTYTSTYMHNATTQVMVRFTNVHIYVTAFREFLRMYVCMYIYTHTQYTEPLRMCVCMHIYVYIHTQTQHRALPG
jgi:hypothetical protein